MYSLSLGLILPLIRKLPFSFGSDVSSSVPVEFINAGTYHFSHIVDNPQQLGISWDYQTLLLTVYAIGVVLLAFRMLFGLLRIMAIWTKSEKVKKGEYTLVISDTDQLPFSFFKNVFISKSFLKKEYIQEVLEHELAHIKHRHTYDVFIVQLLSIIFWWNPLIYIFKKALKETHEYLADAYACLDSDIKNYGLILLGQSSSGIELALTNQFFNSLLKKRINMLNRKKSAGYKMSKYLLAIPLLCFMVILFSASSLHKNDQQQAQEHIHPVQKTIENDKKLKKKLEKKFSEIYNNSQVKGKVREESKMFLNLFWKYANEYSKLRTLRDDFTSIACSYGIKIDVIAEEGFVEFQTFMYVVPKQNFKAWKNGKMPEYDGKVCGPNSIPPPPAPPSVPGPPPGPPVPEFATAYENPNAPLLIVDGEIVEPPFYGKVDFTVIHDSKKIPADIAIKKYGQKAKNGAHIVEYNYPTFGIEGIYDGIIYLNEINELKIKRYKNLEGNLDVSLSHSRVNFETEQEEGINFSVEKMPPNGELDITFEIAGEKKTRSFQVKEHEIVEEEYQDAFIGIESPSNDVLYIGMNNIIKLKTTNVVSDNLEFIIDDEKYYNVEKVTSNDDINEFIVQINALKITPRNITSAITFLFDDGNKITKNFYVRNLQTIVESEIIEEKTQPLTLHNGKEIEFEEDAVIQLDGHIIFYNKEESIEKYGPKGENRAIDLIGTINEKDGFILDITNEPELKQINASLNIGDHRITSENNLNEEPLLIIDGEESTQDLNDIESELIESINVLKDVKAKLKYGAKGENGVIEIITKNDDRTLLVKGEKYTVKGKAIDAITKQPLIGANIVLEGSKVGTITDFSGEYSIEMEEGRHYLVASYVGYNTLTSEVNNESELIFRMVKTNEKNKDNSNDIRTIGNGLNSTKIRIRGSGNKVDDKSPLFIIDGVKSNSKFDVINLNPDNIKKVTVLKEKEDIAKYGEEGENGVILIETKGKVTIETEKGVFDFNTSPDDKNDLELPEPKPLIYIDGVESTESVLSDLSADKIESVNVLKGEKAVEKYGMKGEKGVIEVNIKKQKDNIIVLRVIDGVESEESKNVDSSLKTYSLSPALAKEKANVETDADVVDFVFTKDNHELENKMPLKFKILENPVVNGYLRFEFTSEEILPIDAKILNVSGQLVKSLQIQPQSKSSISEIELNGLTSGMYLLHLQSNGVRVVEQFVVSN